MKHKILLVTLLLLIASAGYAQQQDNKDEVIPFALVEDKPSFMGGNANEFSKWVSTQLKYPKEAKEAKQAGRVTLQFTVDVDGSVIDVQLLRGTRSKALNDEAIRVTKSSPKWTPGKHKGKVVKVTYVFPVIFQL
ncbi:MAG: energy transducer TonB [Bacteroidales bacterium]|nr:energy transducer TonB [Eubacteriales bacterium]MDD4670012.1 energy transducer TonB [Bacteroidales bacterium]